MTKALIMNIQKYSAVAVMGTALCFGMFLAVQPVQAQAANVTELQAMIDALMEQITELQEQVDRRSPGDGPNGLPPAVDFEQYKKYELKSYNIEIDPGQKKKVASIVVPLEERVRYLNLATLAVADIDGGKPWEHLDVIKVVIKKGVFLRKTLTLDASDASLWTESADGSYKVTIYDHEDYGYGAMLARSKHIIDIYVQVSEDGLGTWSVSVPNDGLSIWSDTTGDQFVNFADKASTFIIVSDENENEDEDEDGQCESDGEEYEEGEVLTTITVGGQTQTISDAHFVCRDGEWILEGSYPDDPYYDDDTDNDEDTDESESDGSDDEEKNDDVDADEDDSSGEEEGTEAVFVAGDTVVSTRSHTTKNRLTVFFSGKKGQAEGVVGEVIAGPGNFSGSVWWEVKYENGISAWSPEAYIEAIEGEVLGASVSVDTYTQLGDALTELNSVLLQYMK